MAGFIEWLRTHKFEAYLTAVLLMAVPPVPLYFAAQRGAVGWIWGLISLVVLGNVLVLLIRR
jgi:ABC-type maltose transport system permease subunit